MDISRIATFIQCTSLSGTQGQLTPAKQLFSLLPSGEASLTLVKLIKVTEYYKASMTLVKLH